MKALNLPEWVGPRRVVLAVAVLSASALAVANRGRVRPSFAALASIRPTAVGFALIVVGVGVLGRGRQAQVSHRLLGLSPTLRSMVEVSAASYAVNKVLRSCGTVGIVPFLTEGRASGHGRERVIGAYVAMSAASTVAQGAFTLVVAGLAARTGALSPTSSMLAAGSLALTAATLAALALVVFKGPATLAALDGLQGRLPRQLRGRHRSAAASEVREALVGLRPARSKVAELLGTAVLGKFVGALSLVTVLHGLDAGISVASAAMIYGLGLVASSAGPLPAGVGTTEASLVALLVADGVPAGTAGAAVLAFRLLDVVLPLLVGVAAIGLRARQGSRRATATAVVAAPVLVTVAVLVTPALAPALA